jgi:hypothetical protein
MLTRKIPLTSVTDKTFIKEELFWKKKELLAWCLWIQNQFKNGFHYYALLESWKWRSFTFIAPHSVLSCAHG